MPAVRAIVRDAARDDYRFSSLVLGIVQERAVPDEDRYERRHASRDVHHEEAPVAAHVPARHRRRRWRCRCSTRWCPAAHGAGADGGARRRAASAASTSRTARRWTSGRRPARAPRFEFSEILQPLEPFRDRVCVVSDLAHAPVAPWTGEDTGGAENHVRAAAVFLSGAHPVKKNEAFVGATVDQIAAQHVGQDTPLPVDRAVDRAAEPELRRRRLHLRLPQHAVVEVGDAAAADGEQPAGRVRAAVRRRQHRRAAAGAAQPGAEPARLRDRTRSPSLENGPAGRRPRAGSREYLDEVREIERRVKQVDATLSTRSRSARGAGRHSRPTSKTHLKLMFDLQVLAYKAEITRISTLMFARENSNAVYPATRRARRVPQRLAPLERAQEHGPVRA